MEDKNNGLETTQYLTFRIDDEQYAIDILRVREILRYETLTAVPQAPPFIRGVINLRGCVVPVIDLSMKFGHRSNAVTQWTCIVIVEVDHDGESTTLGVVADAVNQVIDLSEKEVEPPPSFGTKVNTGFLKGMGKTDKKFILILDTEKVLSIDELQTTIRIEEALEASGTEPPPDAKSQEEAPAPQ